ncbi:AT-hook motif nuclear-localized protein 10-like [Phragmites australis]|uniref:AT-hook motif nuclear-localized protein 10-like n=1 Tax=Phragmites australis TaxID=29695 RepID=UPI002D7A10A8|nr:AT-hook motif nuclear-localized protein 10-like [Phragmites australis]XP_062204905.1 AT-hook motif nuclear-localized protein 10-like [Phragmites australis]
MENKDVAPLAAAIAAQAAAAPVPAPASQPPPASMTPQQHQQQPPPFAQQAAPASSPSAPMPSGMRLSFDQMAGKAPGEHQHHPGPMLYAAPPPPAAAAAGAPGGNVLGMGELMRKKRGRPRKYAPDGSMALALAPISSASAGGAAPPGQQQHGFSINSPPSDPNAKRRGRPPGSGKKKQFEALGSWGIAFTPHILTVKAGEDVASKIMTFSQQGPRTVCILSANGAISNVTLRQPATSGGLVTYEGRFEIISLSGSFLLAEDGDTRSRTGGLSVALAGSDGRVLGGCVAGMLLAATPVQVVVASFIAEGKKSKPAEARKVEPMAAPPQMATFVPAPVATSPPSEGTSSASSDDSGSPINHSAMPFNNSGQHQQPHQHQHMPPAYASGGWSLSAAHQQNRHDSDMKMMSN